MLTKGYMNDAGADVILNETIVLPARKTCVIDLGIVVHLKEGTCAIIAPRSSAAKEGIMIATCPIDAGYTGTVNAVVFNSTEHDIEYEAGTAFCQLVILKIENHAIVCDDLIVKNNGNRGANGFGSTGK